MSVPAPATAPAAPAPVPAPEASPPPSAAVVDVSAGEGPGEGSGGGAASGGGGSSSESGGSRDARLRQRWREKFPENIASEDAIDLLFRLMRYHPDARLTASDALLHSYCQVFHDAAFVDHCESKVSTEGFPDNEKKSVHAYRDKLYKMVDDRYPTPAERGSKEGGTSRHTNRHTNRSERQRKEGRRGPS